MRCIGFTPFLLFCFGICAQNPSLVCAPSTPAALPGQTVRLYAWAGATEAGKPVYRWTVSAGEVQPGEGNVFTWKLPADGESVVTADGELRTASIVQARCLIEVQVARSLPATPASPEAAGAGFYSYLLVSASADEANREVIRSVVQAWEALTPPVAALRSLLKPKEAVALAIPVTEPSMARTLLEKISSEAPPGIYIVSSLQPLPGSRPPYLIQDLSHALPSLAAAWVEAFINEAAQEHFWSPSSEAALVDELRNTVGALAGDVPGFRPALLMKWIALL